MREDIPKRAVVVVMPSLNNGNNDNKNNDGQSITNLLLHTCLYLFYLLMLPKLHVNKYLCTAIRS
jgi:hypothetical protein